MARQVDLEQPVRALGIALCEEEVVFVAGCDVRDVALVANDLHGRLQFG